MCSRLFFNEPATTEIYTYGHTLSLPDALPICDGYRVVDRLPRDERTIFVEDTYYSDTPDLDIPALEGRIAAYANAQGWQVEAVVHGESGVLPVVHGGDFDRFWPQPDPVARIGVRAAMFQPMTGYSLPDAGRFAQWLADEIGRAHI